MPRPYAVIDSRTVSTAISVLEVTAPSSMALAIHRAWFTNSSSATSSECDVTLLRKTGTITGTALTPTPLEKSGPAATFTAKRTATGEGTDGDIVAGEGFNVLNGWLYVPTPEERIWVPPSGMLAMKLQAAPSSATYRYGLIVVEYG